MKANPLGHPLTVSTDVFNKLRLSQLQGERTVVKVSQSIRGAVPELLRGGCRERYDDREAQPRPWPSAKGT